MKVLNIFAGFCFSLCFAMPAVALRYATAMEQSQWVAETSPYVCRLEHHVAGYGIGAFVHHAGEKRRLEMDGQGIEFGTAQVKVLAQPPAWQPRRLAESIAEANAAHGELRLDESLSTRVATNLLDGMMIEFQGTLKENESQPLAVSLSTVGFRGPFDEFTACEAQLLPANFEQLERTRVQYAPGQIELDPKSREVLRKLARYLEVDKSVKQIFIDGHTDSQGLTRDNVKISQQRAERVRDFLVSIGVPETLLVVRYHAEKYPVARNNTAANRAKNRRTTIRLSKEFIPQTVPEPTMEPETPLTDPESDAAVAD